jgi:ribosomal subunit interface protein
VEIVIHARNASLASDFKEIATAKLQTLDRFSVQLDSVKVEIKHEQNPRFGKSSHEVTLSTQGSGPFFRAQATGFNDVAAFDEAVKNLEQQIRKVHEKSKDPGRDTMRKHL